ncbi:vegetative cell wall protein gp1 [Brachypodium distachyon]|uniref:Bifunctional inhibitor/plant lipid transfer protein/seed storage helical domain-containing protein n=1 Tax=Brachypodium distachyon TaxID=15368 RepID=A0A2K2DE45_BRADI|nr:vegetative cell wall protein gp1 [Brachypodium distachyon]PNT72564.1 hypothetical protein BRADI_2g46330v3 [Brachypodium distachyon]|eukprot:XP_014754121.1 vegetative cell wall protein gp1 [Brachypodium distachyon]
MALSKFTALFFVFAFVAAARVQGFEEAAAAADHQVPELSSQAQAAAAAGSGGFPGFPLPQIPGFPLPQIPGFPLPQIPGFPLPLPQIPGLPSFPFPPLPQFPGFPPLFGAPGGAPPSPGLPTPPPPPAECLTPLTAMAPCMDYLTNITVPAPPGMCCNGLKSVVSKAPICLCHGMNGGMSKLFPKPIDPIRMLILPARCGTVIPIQNFFMCATQPLPPLTPPASPASPVSPAPPLTTPASPAAPATSPVSPPPEGSP